LQSGPSQEFAYLPSCMNEVFGDSSIAKVLEIADRSGKPVFIPDNIQGFCCGTPFSSKGLTEAYQNQQSKNQDLLSSLTQKTLIIDGSSCHQTISGQSDRRTMELSEFVAENLLDVPVKNRVKTIVLHPTCSGEATGANGAMVAIANRIADTVITPANWRCCGFAGDRGLLVPELTTNATSLAAEELADVDALRVSNNQPCQIGMSSGTSKTYISILEAWVRSVS
jgi:D-lactate dehydrogenase